MGGGAGQGTQAGRELAVPRGGHPCYLPLLSLCPAAPAWHSPGSSSTLTNCSGPFGPLSSAWEPSSIWGTPTPRGQAPSSSSGRGEKHAAPPPRAQPPGSCRPFQTRPRPPSRGETLCLAEALLVTVRSPPPAPGAPASPRCSRAQRRGPWGVRKTPLALSCQHQGKGMAKAAEPDGQPRRLRTHRLPAREAGQKPGSVWTLGALLQHQGPSSASLAAAAAPPPPGPSPQSLSRLRVPAQARPGRRRGCGSRGAGAADSPGGFM